MPFAESCNARIYYETRGQGQALVFAHGAGGNTASWWQQVPFFSSSYRVLTFDHRGFGRSQCAAENFSPSRFDDDLLAILDQEEIESAHLVCQSMGGWTGVRTAALHPERVKSLVLANTPGAVYTDVLIERLVGLPGPNDNPEVVSIAISDVFAKADPQGAHLYQQISNFNQPPIPIARLVEPESFVGADKLKDFRIPTLTITSELDAIFPRALLEESAAVIGAKTVFVENCGHSTYFENPQRFNEIVDGFLTAHG